MGHTTKLISASSASSAVNQPLVAAVRPRCVSVVKSSLVVEVVFVRRPAHKLNGIPRERASRLRSASCPGKVRLPGGAVMHVITILGGGLVGSAIARDLAVDANLSVRVVDINDASLSAISARIGSSARTIRADLSDPARVASVIADADLVIGAVPGWMGFQVLSTIIANRKSFVDISFMPEDASLLSAKAREAGVVGVVDCSVAPGMSNALTARAVSEFDEPLEARIYVGGLPQVRRWPYDYAAVFSPIDVIEEYTRPARFVEHGQVVTREALSDVELLEFEGVGTLEAFNTDGLRSLMHSLKVPWMKEKTMRFPGHVERMRMLRESGFFSTEPLRVGAVELRPVDMTCRLLSRAWKLPEGEGDITVMRIEVFGRNGGKSMRQVFDLLDRYDPESRITSMARTTGFPCAIVARMLLDGGLKLQPGVYFPEAIAPQRAALDRLLSELARRNVVFRHRTEPHPEAARS